MMKRVALLLAMLMFFIPTVPVQAAYSEGERWFASLDEETRYLIQAQLVLVGLYDRYIDGEFGQGTFSAITTYQRQQGTVPTGRLTERQRTSLLEEASQVFSTLGFTDIEDDKAGLALMVPTKLLPSTTSTRRGTLYSTGAGDLTLETIRKPLADQSFERLFAEMSAVVRGRRVTYSLLQEDTFTVSGLDNGRPFYTRFYNDGTHSVGYVFSWTEDNRRIGRMVSIMLANFSVPIARDEEVETPKGEIKATSTPQYSSGTGFFVNAQGLIVTNHHVAGNCSALEVVGHGSASYLTGQEDIDVAVIRVGSGEAKHWASIRADAPRLAEDVLLVGYPLATLLDSSLNVTTGIISAETGLGGNRDWFTTNAGIQPGNSGGPILDEHGNVIGVAVAKINEAKLLEMTGNTAPNLGFAIKSEVVLKFLEVFQHSAVRASTEPPKRTQQIASEARAFTVQILCTERPATVAAN